MIWWCIVKQNTFKKLKRMFFFSFFQIYFWVTNSYIMSHLEREPPANSKGVVDQGKGKNHIEVLPLLQHWWHFAKTLNFRKHCKMYLLHCSIVIVSQSLLCTPATTLKSYSEKLIAVVFFFRKLFIGHLRVTTFVVSNCQVVTQQLT